MRSLFLTFILFSTSKLFAVNFIDNPNFDLTPPDDGWIRCTKSGCFYDYEESNRSDTIKDKLFAMCAEEGKCGCVSYKMKNVPKDYPLYAYAEVSHAGWGESSYFNVTVELTEDDKVLSKKVVRIKGHKSWHVVATDYPAYKQKDHPNLTLKIWFDCDKTGDVQLNYAQVGTDPHSLGGRGPRPKNLTYGE